MWLDELSEFCDATALNTGGAASYLIGDVMDSGAVSRDLGNGETIYCVIQVDTEVDSAADNTTQQFHLCSDAQAAIAVDGTATYHFSTGVLAQATLVAGYTIACFALPYGTYERYLGIVHTTAVAAATAGKVNAFLTKDPAKYTNYPDGI
jgi:hypothetical protein